ncbi:MAG: hypothetical protein GF398_00035 [Chitinivibrionales bacterium]|nr:hypothetical protein [Chitinivibrionales bacterium]
MLRRKLDKMFAAALRDKDIQAWVCANVQTAIAALDFLKKKRIAVPGSISVIGFDDSVESLQHNLTSFNFNMRACAHCALNFILRKQYSRNPVDRGEMIIERASSR